MQTEVPTGWTLEPLNRLGSFHKGRGGSKKDERESGIPVVRYGELYTRHHDVIRGFHSFVSPQRAKDYSPLQVGDVLFAGSGETLAEIGKSAAFLGPEPAHGSGDLIIFRPGPRLDPLFLGYATNGVEAVEQKKRMGQGSSVMHIHAHNLERLEVPLPPLPEQKKIAAILSSVDEAIQATQGVIDQARRVKAGLLQDLLTRGIGHTRFKESPIGEIPVGWEVVPFGKLAALGPQNGLYKGAQFYGSGTPMLDMGELFACDVIGPYDRRRLELTKKELEGFVLLDGDLLFARRSLVASGSGKCSLVGQMDEYPVFESSIIRFRLRSNDCFPAYYAHLWNSPLGQKLRLGITRQVAVSGVTGKDLAKLKVPIPPLQEQERIAATVDVTIKATDTANRQIEQLRQVKAGLLQDLLTGKVRVTP